MKSVVFLMFAAVLGGTGRAEPNAPSNEGSTLLLSGSDWFIHEDADGVGVATPSEAGGWIPATVPGNIQADLETAHLLKPLWYGAGDPRLYDVARKDWWIRKEFVVPKHFEGKRLTLVFEGVDHQCDVWVNGKQLGSNAGMFRRFRFDVAGVVKPGQENSLAVRIAKMPDELASSIVSSDGAMSSGHIDGINLTRQTLKELKSPTNYGWDWGVNIWTLGIWKDVRLVASGPARIDWTQVQTTLNTDSTKAVVAATLEIDSMSEQPAKAVFKVTGHGQEASATSEIALKQGVNRVKAQLNLDKPALWWCNGHGSQPLYTLDVQLQPAGGGAAMDTGSTRFGVRDVRWVPTEGAPKDYVSRFQLILNGQPVRTMGTCMIPPDLLYGRACPRGLQLLHRAKDAQMTMVRMWGGGVIMPDEFYALADELGIMLSVEFPLANCTPETDAVFLGNLETTVRNIVKQVRNHPAIIEYTGGNEMNWNSLTKHPAWDVIQKIVREDDGRLVRATCPDMGAAHSPWDFDIDSGYRHYNRVETMRYGEFGTASPANLEVWHRTIPPRSQWPIQGVGEPVLIRKNVVQAVFSSGHWLLKNRIDNAFGALDNLPDLIQAGQLLGAEGLRYAIDANRRRGRRIGGFTTWDFNEPWPNGAGSYLVDYDGRTLMNYDFVKQALAPVSMSLKCDSILYNPEAGVKFELWLTSDAPQAAKDLQWQLLARDRRGTVFAREQGVASIEPLEVKQLKVIALAPPKKVGSGPVFVELQLRSAQGNLVVERLHVFGSAGKGSLGGMLVNGQKDTDDDAPSAVQVERPDGKSNLAFVGNGANPATASSTLAGFDIHQPRGLNDGLYGNEHSWIAAVPRAWFQIDLGKAAGIGRFKLGRDRTGQYDDRGVDYMKIEASGDGRQWKTVFEKAGLTKLSDYDPAANMEICVTPVRAQWVRVTVDSGNSASACIDEVEVYGPAPEVQGNLPQVAFRHLQNPGQPVRRTSLAVSLKPVRMEGDRESIDFVVSNTGGMTALFCEPHPLIEYRTDLFIENNHCFIPPGENRTITIRSARHPKGGLSLAQTGWRISTWNADDQLIEPSRDVLLAVGRRDRMCREFAGYDGAKEPAQAQATELMGRRPDTSTLPYRLHGAAVARFKFTLEAGQAGGSARLRLHTADQSAALATNVAITVNGRSFVAALPKGLSIQDKDPAHLAFPATVTIDLPAGTLKAGENLLEFRVRNGGWFTWDALDLASN